MVWTSIELFHVERWGPVKMYNVQPLLIYVKFLVFLDPEARRFATSLRPSESSVVAAFTLRLHPRRWAVHRCAKIPCTNNKV